MDPEDVAQRESSLIFHPFQEIVYVHHMAYESGLD